MKSAVQQYNELNGQVVTREDLERIAIIGSSQGQSEIASKLLRLLDNHEDLEFKINLSKSEIERVPESDLPGLEYAFPDDEFDGLEKAVSPDDIYQYVTDLILNTIKNVGDLPWQQEWEKTSLYNGYQALNFESKNGYRGINYFLLNFEVKEIEGEAVLVPADLENPYFLTFKQIEKNGGKLKKGSEGKKVVYFTKLYFHEETLASGEVLSFGSYSQKKFTAWIKKNQNKLQILKRSGWSIERLAKSYIPILKYYNVFNGSDVTGVDWGLIPKNENVEKPENERIAIAENIIKLYPEGPKIIYKGDQPAYYPKLDQIIMTPIEAFKKVQAFYSTLFHECVHSTGHSKRLDRGNDTRVRDKSKEDKKAYAFEELVAEMGAVFLCAESGILFSTLNNSAVYLKGWNSRLVDQMKEDNRFFFRAASRSQAASDLILDKDKNGVAAYQNSINSGSTKKVAPDKNKVKSKVTKDEEKITEETSDYPFSKEDIPYQTAYNAHAGTSFSPEKRAKSEQNSYFSFLKDTYDWLKKKAIKADRLEEFEDKIPRFIDGYKKRYLQLLQSRNGLMSTMITGPSNFPVRRMEKKNNTIGKRLNELVDYGDKAEKYVLPVRSNAIKTGKVDTISKLQEKLKELETTHEKMKDINKILRKFQNKKYSQEEREAGVIEALEKIGYSEKDTRKNFLGEKKLPSFMLSNSNANIKRIKDRIAEEEKLKGQEEQSFPFDGGTIYFRPEINKVQIEFDGKPEKEIRDFLKKAGHAFKWSPINKVWQRQLNTYYSLNKKDLAEFLGIDTSKGLNAAWHDKGTIEREALNNCSRLEKGYKYTKGGTILKVDPEPKKEKPAIKPAKKPVIKVAAAAVKKPAKIAVKKPVIKVVKDAESEGSVLKYPISKIRTDEKRFQNRSKLSENTVLNIVENYSPTQLDPLIVWKDPKTGKTFLLAGHHRLEALKRLNKKTAPVKFANKDFPTEKNAIKYARQLSNANRTLEQPHERANLYREMRLNGESKKKIDKAAHIEGKNRSYILNLSYLNPKGTISEGLTRFEDATDKDSSSKVEKIADWIGQGRRQNEQLTNAHESEMYKFLNDAALSKRISSKADFLQKMTSITGTIFFDYSEPLNLAKFKYQTEGEKVYDAEVEEIKEEISTRQKNIDEIKIRFLDPSNKKYISPEAKDYHIAKNIADEKISKYNFDIHELQNLLQKQYQNKGKYVNAGSNQVGLFGAWKKKRNARKKKPGLNGIVDDAISAVVTTVVDKTLSKVKNSRIRNMAATRGNDNSEFFNVPGEVGKFLQAVEKKPKQSVVITIDGHQGAGKTTTLYKFMNAFAAGKNRSLFASLEEHPDSSLAKDKEQNYINPENRPFIDTIGELESKEEFYSLIENYDIIFIDSWQKLLRMIGNIRLDEDLRKHFDGKVFVVIFQQTTTGRTKGGAEVVFDGDIIIKMVKGDKFSENYAYFDKNRYTKVPIETLRYNIAGGNVYNPEEKTYDVSDIHFEEVKEDPINSRIVTPGSGRLIATPVI